MHLGQFYVGSLIAIGWTVYRVVNLRRRKRGYRR